MVPVSSFSGLPVAVLGLGRAGLASAQALQQGGATVWAWDDSKEARDRAVVAGVPVVDLETCNWRELTTLVLSPGIPLHHPEPHPVVAAAEAADCEVIGEMELLSRAAPEAAFIGITGTNGKSTTTALIGHIFEVAEQTSAVGGNLGRPALDLDRLGKGGTYVLELSSYQLDLVRSAHFDAAILLNISPDHLDRHGGLDGYIEAKKRIFERQSEADAAIVGLDDEHCRAIHAALAEQGGRRVVGISSTRKIAGGVYCTDGMLVDDLDGTAREVMNLRGVETLPGAHNWQNAAAAYAACRARGLHEKTIANAMASYPGLAHRQERVPGPDHVIYVNDSKATNPEATLRALVCYDDIYWIAGGRPKAGGFDMLGDALGGVRHALLIGEAADALEAFLEGRVPVTLSGTLDRAVRQATTLAHGQGAERPVVLFSPACASFDQFANFEQRGDAFRAAVAGLSHDGRAAMVGGGSA